MTEPRPFSSISECPTCGRTLDSGVVIPGRGLAWNPTPAKFTLGSVFEWLSYPVRLRYDNFPARRCTNCKLVLFQYR